MNKPNAVACALIDRFFGDAMELCVGQTPETISKPDPYSMDPVLERLGIPREQILYVGDTDVDMQTARNTANGQPLLPPGAISRSKCCYPTIRNSSSADRNSCSRFFRRNSSCFRK